MNKAFVLGSINIDYVLTTDKLPKVGETIFGTRFLKNYGGKGANQAVAIAKQDIMTHFIGCVGKDPDGDKMLSNLSKYGINTEYINIVDKTSGKAFITVCNNDNSIIVIKGANKCISKEQIIHALTFAEKGDYFITQYEVEPEVVAFGLKEAKKKEMITVVNPSPIRFISDELYGLMDYLVLNKDESEQLTKINYLDNPFPVFKFFKDKGVKEVVITLGEIGADCLASNIAIDRQLGYKVKTVDTTSAGDTFLGAFTAALMQGKLVSNAVIYANRAASLACTKLGAQKSIPSKADIEKYMK